MQQARPILPGQEIKGAAIYPNSTIVATLTADRLREAQTARTARVAARRRPTRARCSTPVHAAIAAVVAAGRADAADDRVGA